MLKLFKNKKGAEIGEIVKIIIVVMVLVVMVAGAIYLFKIKGGAGLSGIKNLLHFGK